MYAEEDQGNEPTEPEFEELSHVKKKPIKGKTSSKGKSKLKGRKVSEQRQKVGVHTVTKSHKRTHKDAAALSDNPKPNKNQSQKVKAVLSANQALLAARQEIL